MSPILIISLAILVSPSWACRDRGALSCILSGGLGGQHNRDRGRGCFSLDTAFSRADGTTVTLSDLEIGDEIVTVDRSGSLRTDTVFFLVKEHEKEAELVHLMFHDEGFLDLTPNHMVHVGGDSCCG